MRWFLCAVLVAGGLIGCASSEPVDRESRLLTMAAGEAQQIPDSTQRLTRQLNFASQQMSRGKSGEAKQSLAYAAQTLRDAKTGELISQIRIAGWVSISELSRQAEDRATAQAACDQAVAVLTSLDPIRERPEYVVGVSLEVETLQGKAAASKLLESSATWIKEIPEQEKRRTVLAHITKRIFDYDEFDGGLQALRTDSDPAWRSDTLAQFAEQGRQSRQALRARSSPLTPSSFIDPTEFEPGEFSGYGYDKSVDYQSVFLRSKGQN